MVIGQTGHAHPILSATGPRSTALWVIKARAFLVVIPVLILGLSVTVIALPSYLSEVVGAVAGVILSAEITHLVVANFRSGPAGLRRPPHSLRLRPRRYRMFASTSSSSKKMAHRYPSHRGESHHRRLFAVIRGSDTDKRTVSLSTLTPRIDLPVRRSISAPDLTTNTTPSGADRTAAFDNHKSDPFVVTHLDDLATAHAHLCSTFDLLGAINSSEGCLPSYSYLVLDEVVHFVDRAVLALDEFSGILSMNGSGLPTEHPEEVGLRASWWP